MHVVVFVYVLIYVHVPHLVFHDIWGVIASSDGNNGGKAAGKGTSLIKVAESLRLAHWVQKSVVDVVVKLADVHVELPIHSVRSHSSALDCHPPKGYICSIAEVDNRHVASKA